VRLVHREVPSGHGQIDRLHDDAALPVQDTECVDQAQNVAERLDVAVAPAFLQIVDMRRAGDGAEVDDVAADVQVAV
jgi:hypothetical protein